MTHPARFARSLALSTTLVACSSSSSAPNNPAPEPAPTATAETTETPAPPVVDDAGSTDAAPAEGGRVSGPLPPPELPA